MPKWDEIGVVFELLDEPDDPPIYFDVDEYGEVFEYPSPYDFSDAMHDEAARGYQDAEED